MVTFRSGESQASVFAVTLVHWIQSSSLFDQVKRMQGLKGNFFLRVTCTKRVRIPKHMQKKSHT